MAKEQPSIIILIGPPGSGKGTQAKQLTTKYGLPQVSTGDLVRQQINERTPIGLKIENLVNSGKFPPDQLILEMLAIRLKAPDCRKGFILDGCPRNKSQAQTFDKYLKIFNIKPTVLVIDVPDAVIKDRLIYRVICEKCHTPYHLKYAPPKQEGKCDLCQGALIKRTDDSEQVIDYRLQIYHEQTQPLIEFYRKKGCLNIIDGTQPKEEVTTRIEQILAQAGCPA